MSKAALERNELCAMWLAEYGDISADYFIWLDDSSIDDHINQHTHGWAAVGHACVLVAVKSIWTSCFHLKVNQITSGKLWT